MTEFCINTKRIHDTKSIDNKIYTNRNETTAKNINLLMQGLVAYTLKYFNFLYDILNTHENSMKLKEWNFSEFNVRLR